MPTDNHSIAKIFNQIFAQWQIVLPQEALAARYRGEYLDYYATHCMAKYPLFYHA